MTVSKLNEELLKKSVVERGQWKHVITPLKSSPMPKKKQGNEKRTTD